MFGLRHLMLAFADMVNIYCDSKKMKCCSLSIKRKTTKGAWGRSSTFEPSGDQRQQQRSRIARRVRNTAYDARIMWHHLERDGIVLQNFWTRNLSVGTKSLYTLFWTRFFLIDFDCIFVFSGESVALLYENVLVIVLTLRSFQFFNFFVCFKACQVV